MNKPKSTIPHPLHDPKGFQAYLDTQENAMRQKARQPRVPAAGNAMMPPPMTPRPMSSPPMTPPQPMSPMMPKTMTPIRPKRRPQGDDGDHEFR